MTTPHPRRTVVTGDLFHPVIPTGALWAMRHGGGQKRSPYYNPHPVGDEGRKPKPCPVPACQGAVHDRAEALRLYGQHLDAHPQIVRQAAAEPADASFACRCRLDARCHVDVLLARVDQLPDAA
jgi:hypothetical protein